jgi:hypothetical protein
VRSKKLRRETRVEDKNGRIILKLISEEQSAGLLTGLKGSDGATAGFSSHLRDP